MSSRMRNPPIAGPSIAAVVGGETEAWYLNMLKRNEKDIRITIKPEIHSKKSLKDQYEKVVLDLVNKEFTKVFWIVDLDSIIKETREAPRGAPKPMEVFKNYRQTLIEKYRNVTVIVNNPCLEFWFLLHFEKTNKHFNNCSKVEAQLKKHIKNYEKTKRYFTKKNDDIYLKLKPGFFTALENAAALGNFDERNPNKAICEMKEFFFCEELRNYFE